VRVGGRTVAVMVAGRVVAVLVAEGGNVDVGILEPRSIRQAINKMRIKSIVRMRRITVL
jgi:hypothetical protein